MSRSLTLSEETFRQLAESTCEAEFKPQSGSAIGADRLRRVRELRERVAQECGALPDSVDLIREDRER